MNDTPEAIAARKAALDQWERAIAPPQNTVKMPNRVRQKTKAELAAGAQQIIQPGQSKLKVSFPRASSREDNGSAYCGRPRLASAKHRQMREAAYGDKSKFDSLHNWQG
jgi:hypothetical protein